MRIHDEEVQPIGAPALAGEHTPDERGPESIFLGARDFLLDQPQPMPELPGLRRAAGAHGFHHDLRFLRRALEHLLAPRHHHVVAVGRGERRHFVQPRILDAGLLAFAFQAVHGRRRVKGVGLGEAQEGEIVFRSIVGDEPFPEELELAKRRLLKLG